MMGIAHTIENLFQMSDEVWARHANPWSVWTRYSGLPLLALAIWSRSWIGVYAIPLVILVIVWIWINPRIFSKPKSTKNWASRAVLGERVWLTHPKQDIPTHHLTAIKYLNVIMTLSFAMALYGLFALHPWFTIFGTLMTVIGKSWFLDRMVWLFQDLKMSKDLYQSWDY